MYSHSTGGQKYRISFTGLKSKVSRLISFRGSVEGLFLAFAALRAAFPTFLGQWPFPIFIAKTVASSNVLSASFVTSPPPP